MSIRALGYIPELDGLRGLAVLAVFLYHGQWLGVESGLVGVDLFFVLSGFLITRLLIEEYSNVGSVDLRGFYIRRALRLFPALLLMIFVLGVVAVFSNITFDPVTDVASTLLYVRNYYGILADANTGLTAHLWSLSVEEQFYFVWPVITIGLLRRHGVGALRITSAVLVVLAALGTITLAANGTDLFSLYTNTVTHGIVGLVGGAALGASPKLLTALSERVSLWCGAGGLGLLIGVCFIPAYDPTHVETGFLPVTLFSLAAVAGATTGGLSFLTFKPIVGLGKISYGFYLWHLPVIEFVGYFIPGGSRWFVFGEILSLTLLVTLTSYYVVERPALALKSKLGAARRQPAVGSPQDMVGTTVLRELVPSGPTTTSE